MKRVTLFFGLILISVSFKTVPYSLIGSQPDAIKTDALTSAYPFEIIDVMPDFWNFWDNAEGLDDGAKISLFREILIIPNRELYQSKMMGEISDERIENYLESIQPIIPEMRRYGSELTPHYLISFWMQFLKYFPDFEGRTTVYLMPSLYTFEGQARPINGKMALFLGLDAIARSYSSVTGPFIHHELFHVYHLELVPEMKDVAQELFFEDEFPELYTLVWAEGLAVYVSKVLNSEVSDREILSDAHALEEEIIPLLPILAREVRNNLDATSEEDIGKFFYNPNAEFPTNSGYYIGWRVAKELANKYPLAQLVRLDGDQLYNEIVMVLRKLENIE